jgi:hypothetical protein
MLIPPGATTIVAVAPAAIFASDALRPVAQELVSAERLDAFRARHGVDLRTLERLVIAEYGPSEGLTEGATIYFARGAFHAEVVVAEIGNRMSPLESEDSRPVMRRAGTYRMQRVELLALGPTTVALTDGPPALSGRIVATQQAARTRAETGSFDAPLVLMRHGRPDLPPEGLGLLLARLEHTTVTFNAVGLALEIDVQLQGEFPPGAEDNFRTLVTSIAQSDLGHALGMQEVARSLVVHASSSEVSMHATADAATIASGLRALVGAEMDELLALP